MVIFPQCKGGEKTEKTDDSDVEKPAVVQVASKPLDLKDLPSLYDDNSLDILTMTIKTVTAPDSPYTLADVNNDTDPHDENNPYVDCFFSTASFTPAENLANAELSIRGHSTRFAKQKSYRIKLKSKSDLWRGSRRIQLNKHPYDLTRVRNKLSFDLIKGVSNITSLRTQFVRLMVDNEDYGLYTQVEYVGERYLTARKLELGNLYKAEFFEFHRDKAVIKLKTDQTYQPEAFEKRLEIKGSSDHTALIAMLDAVNDEKQDFKKLFATYFHLDNYTTWLAINILLGNYDTNSQNFYLYRPQSGHIWYFLPWDYDGALGFNEQPKQKSRPRWQMGISNWWGVTLFRRFIREKTFLKALKKQIETLRDNPFFPLAIETRLNRYKALIRPLILEKPDLLNLPTLNYETAADEFDQELARLPAQIEVNYQRFIRSLAFPMPVFLGDLTWAQDQFSVAWSPSYDLQGDSLTYDFALSTTPDFAPDTIKFEKKTLSTTKITAPLTLPTGKYYYRVIIRDQSNPEVNWQTAFDNYWDEQTGQVYGGVRSFTVP